jgi:uncharacterized protein with HEPN domain
MSHHDPLVRVLHMRDYSREAIDLLGSKTLDELQKDRTLQLALLQLIEIIGEASTRISQDFKQQHPSVPWSKAAAMRNRLIHGYDAVNIPIVFNTIRTHLPPLLEQLEQLLVSGEVQSPPLPPPLGEEEAS